MNCISCGTINMEGAVHCHNCGVKLAPAEPTNHSQEVAATVQQQQPIYQNPIQGQIPVPPQGYQQVPPVQGYTQAPQGNGYQQQSQVPQQQGHANPAHLAPDATKDQLKVVKEYFNYVWAILKKPHFEAFAKDKNQLLFGAINIIAFAILFGLTTWFLMDNLLKVFGESASFLSSFIIPVIGSAFFLAIGGCVAFGLTKLNKLTTNFVDVLSQWFAYMAIPAAIMPLIFLTALVGLSKLSMVLLAIAFITVFASAASIVKHYKLGESNVIDPMYSTVIFFAVQGLVLYFIFNRILASIINAFGSGYANMFGGW